jgi:AraC-like DNA-binding protein
MPTNRTWIEQGKYFEVKFKFGLIPFFSGCKNFQQFPINASHLFCPLFIQEMENAGSFEERVNICNRYFTTLSEKYRSSTEKYRVIEKMVRQFHEHNDGNFRIMEGLKNNFVSSKSLQRYFLKNFGITPKAVFCILRMRKALESYFDESQSFRVYDFDYYDYSHFYKEIKKLIGLNLPQLKQDRSVNMDHLLTDTYHNI